MERIQKQKQAAAKDKHSLTNLPDNLTHPTLRRIYKMKTKLHPKFLPFSLLDILMALIVIFGATWVGVYAQGPDFEAADATTATLSIFSSPIADKHIPVGERRCVTTVNVTNVDTGNDDALNRILAVIDFPDEFVTTTSADITIDPAMTALGCGFTAGPTVSGGKINFTVSNAANATCAIPEDGNTYPLVNICWTGKAYSNGEAPVTFEYAEIVDTVGNTAAYPVGTGRVSNGSLIVDRPDITVYIDRNSTAPPDYHIKVGETLVTNVMADDVFGVDQVSFTLHFDERFVKVLNVEPGEFFTRNNGAADPIDIRWNNSNGVITFNAKRSPYDIDADGATIAKITWEGLSPGTSPQSFTGNVLMFDNNVNIEDAPSTTVITELDGGNIVVEPQLITIYFDPGELKLAANYKPVAQEVKLRGVRKVGTVEFEIHFDPTIMKVVDGAKSDQLAKSIEVGSLFGSNYFVEQNSVDHNKGIIKFKVDTNDPITKDGTVAIIHWKGLQYATPRALPFYYYKVLDAEHVTIPNTTAEDGTVEIGYGPNKNSKVSINPLNHNIYNTGTGHTFIQLEDVRNLSSAAIEVKFDPHIVYALNVSPNAFGGIVSYRNIDNSAGLAKFVISDIDSGAAQGAVAVITWQGKNSGVTPLELQNVVLVQDGYTTTPAELVNGAITVSSGSGGTPTPPPQPGDDIDAVLSLEAFGAASGIEVYVDTANCPAGSFSKPAGVKKGETDGLGQFHLSGDATYKCLYVYRKGYLIGMNPQPWGNLGGLELPAGDIANGGDNKIDITDLTVVAGLYGQADSIADYNRNGAVDIGDLAVVAGNYGKTGPTQFWLKY